MGGDWFYKIYVTRDAPCGAVIAGQVADVESADLQLVTPSMAKRALSDHEQLEARYDVIDPNSPEFLALDKRNFQLTGPMIEKVQLRAKKHWWTATLPNSGTMEIFPRDQRKKWFVLYGHQYVEAIAQLLRTTSPNVVVRPK